jgi:hypothetical protein
MNKHQTKQYLGLGLDTNWKSKTTIAIRNNWSATSVMVSWRWIPALSGSRRRLRRGVANHDRISCQALGRRASNTE